MHVVSRFGVSLVSRFCVGEARLYFCVQSSVSRSWVVTPIRDFSMFAFYFGSILVISSWHCCMYFFRVFFGVRGFTCGSLLFLSFVFVRGPSVLRTDSLVEGLSSLTRVVIRLRLTFAVSFLFLFLFYLSFSFLLL